MDSTTREGLPGNLPEIDMPAASQLDKAMLCPLTTLSIDVKDCASPSVIFAATPSWSAQTSPLFPLLEQVGGEDSFQLGPAAIDVAAGQTALSSSLVAEQTLPTLVMRNTFWELAESGGRTDENGFRKRAMSDFTGLKWIEAGMGYSAQPSGSDSDSHGRTGSTGDDGPSGTGSAGEDGPSEFCPSEVEQTQWTEQVVQDYAWMPALQTSFQRSPQPYWPVHAGSPAGISHLFDDHLQMSESERLYNRSLWS